MSTSRQLMCRIRHVKEKMELDEKNIYRFGMGLNTAGLKDTAATTNIAIKAAYSLLELQCNKLEIRLKKLLRHLVRIVIEEIKQDRAEGLSGIRRIFQV